MVSSIGSTPSIVPSSVTSASGAASLLQSASSDSSGLFDALSGMTGDTNAALFSALGGNNGQPTSINSILHGQDVNSTKNQIFADAATRLDYIAQGQYQPQADWEKVAAYAMQTGQPVSVTLDASGNVTADLQANADLSKYGPQRSADLQQAISDVTLMAKKIQANATNDGWIAKLTGAENDLQDVFNGALLPQTSTPNNWEQNGLLLMEQNLPMKISLDPQGNLQVTDQRIADNSDLSPDMQQTLQTAVESIGDVINKGSYTETWQLDAANFASQGIPYYIDIDKTTGQLSAKENSGDNIVPDFLKIPPYADTGEKNSDGMQQAADFIRAGKAFYMDYDQTGQTIIAKEATAQNLIKLNQSSTQSSASTLGAGSILSLFA